MKTKKPVTFRIMGRVARALTFVSPNLAARWLERMFVTPMKYRISDREKDLMCGAESWRILVDAKRSIPLYSWGSGPTILLVHGLSGRGSQMGHFVRPLLDRGFRVVAFDAPAHGSADGKQTAPPDMASALDRVAQELGPIDGCIAHSAGAAATTISLSRGMECKRVVYISPPDDLRGYLVRLSDFMGFSEAVCNKTQKRVEKRYKVAFEALRGSKLVACMSVPALIIHDQYDAMVPFEEGQTLARLWPGASLMETQGLGHSRILRDKKVIAAGVEYLSTGRETA